MLNFTSSIPQRLRMFFNSRVQLLIVALASSSLSFSQGSPCLDNTIGISALQSDFFCHGATRIETTTSEPGVRYFLRNEANNAVVYGPLSGTGSALSFPTGQINATTTYNVYGEKASGGLQFDGTDDYVNISGLTNLSGNAITIEYWFKGTIVQSAVRYQSDGSNYIVSGWNNKHIMSNDGGSAGGIDMGATVTDGQWHHVAMTWQINTMNGFKSYLDGVLVEQRNSANAPIPNMGYNLLLGSVLGTNEFTNGTLDDVRIWSVARTQSEIQASMNTCLSGPISGLLAHYKFEDGVGSSSVTDASGNNHHGTMNNMNSSTSWVLGTFNCLSCALEMNQQATVTIQSLEDLPLTANDNSFCGANSGTTITIPSSQTGAQYYLRDNENDTIVDGPITGNGASLSFNTGPINQTMNYNVYASKSTTPVSSALNFDGVDDKIALGGSGDLDFNSTTPFTIETRFNWTGDPSGFLVSKYSGSGYYIRLVTGSIQFLMRDDNLNTINVINTQGLFSLNTWHHLAISYDGSMTSAGVRMYLDGTLITLDQDLSSTSLQPFTNTGITYLGHRPSSVYYNGALGETRFWNTVRSASEIAANYNTCLSGSEAGLIAYYNFGDESGSSTLRDLSSSAIDGTLMNFDVANSWTSGPLNCTFLNCELEMTDIETVLVSSNSDHTESISACGSYDWNGTTYTTSGLYTDTLSSIAGCDSIVHLDLTIVTIEQYTVSAATTQLCQGNTGTTIDLSNSQVGVNYSFYDAVADTLISGPIAGTGNPINFSTGALPNTMTYKIIGENPTNTLGSAVQFDGVDDYLELTNNPYINVAGFLEIVEAWVYLNSYGNGGTILRFGEATQFFYDSVGRLHLAADGGNWGGVRDYYDSLGASIPLHQWVNVAYSYDVYWNATLYINGVAQPANKSDFHPFTTSYNATTFGGAAAGASRGWPMDGKLDEIAMFIQYSYSEITDLSCIDPNNPNLLFYLDFEEGAGNTVTDTIFFDDSFVMQNMNPSTAWQFGIQCSTCSSEMANQITVNVGQTTNSITTVSECDSYSWNGNTYTTSGTYTWQGTNAAGCDSTATLNLTINTASTSSTTVTACDSYHWNGSVYSTSGTYTWMDTNAAGCDSIATLHLTINNSTNSTASISACNFYTWNGTTYNTSGIYNWFGTNMAGCDSMATLDLTINYPTENTINVIACDSFTLNGQTYTSSGTFGQNLTNVEGCDSTLTLNLTINNSTTSTITATSCDSYSLNGQTYTASGVYTQNLTNAAGCDSTLTLNLTINNSTSSVTTIVECDSYTWNGTTYSTSGTYIWNGTNTVGCDSTATLNLTINTVDASVTDNSPTLEANLSGATYQWVDCGNNYAPISGETGQSFTATVNGSYAVLVTSNNCTDTSACFNVNNVGLDNIDKLDYVHVYPNPFGNEFFIELTEIVSDATIEIHTADGRLVDRIETLNSQSLRIDSRDWETGVYFLSLAQEEVLINIRLVKH